MSFSSELKEELIKFIPSGKKVQMAELSALLSYGMIELADTAMLVSFHFLSPNINVTKKVIILLRKIFELEVDVFVRRIHQTELFGIEITGRRTVKNLFSILKIKSSKNSSLIYVGEPETIAEKMAFARGAFIMMGSMSDPMKSYHLEFNAQNEKDAVLLKNIIAGDASWASISKRKGSYPVYVKDGSMISDLLVGLSASKAMLEFENARVVRETRGNINRRVNCEVSNLKKTAEAGRKQIDLINVLINDGRFESLPDNLKCIAELRLENPDSSLQELGEMMNPPLGRSGVAHRLYKIMEIAEKAIDN